ncbi:hypothetical protein OTU49_001288 [Cherax quadricarinatus]|uniref:Uncharacterized protein n=1 Tax=Cherax quadricarinatus TaxID=27406 RepID=A0AAW0XTR2_CHEQU
MLCKKKTMCQDMTDEASSEDEGEAEHDELLIEYAGEVVPSLGKAMSQAEFATQFANLLPLFANKTKKSCSVAERSFSFGTLAEAVEALGSASGQFVPQLLPLFQEGTRDEDNEVRSNSIYGLGVLGQHETNQLIQELVKSVSHDFPDQVTSVVQSLEPEVAGRLQAAVAAAAAAASQSSAVSPATS